MSDKLQQHGQARAPGLYDEQAQRRAQEKALFGRKPAKSAEPKPANAAKERHSA